MKTPCGKNFDCLVCKFKECQHYNDCKALEEMHDNENCDEWKKIADEKNQELDRDKNYEIGKKDNNSITEFEIRQFRLELEVLADDILFKKLTEK
jgi:hypothetical protein